MSQLFFEPELPWSSSVRDDKKFFQILIAALAIMTLFGVIIPNIQLPEITREEKAELPPQLAKIILEEKKVDKPKPKPKPIEVKEEKKLEQEPEKPKIEEKKTEQKVVQAAIDKAKTSGLLALQDDLADLRETFDVETISSADLNKGQQKSEIKKSQVIAKTASSKSGGVSSSNYTTNLAATDLDNKRTARVQLPTALEASSPEVSGIRGQEASLAGRSDENIRSILERHKGALYAIYNRALRKNPTLQGRIEFEIEIDASGSVTNVKIITSSINDLGLERKLSSRIKLINFGKKSVATTTTNWRIDFVPS